MSDADSTSGGNVLWEREITSTSDATSMGRYRIVRDEKLWATLQLQHGDGSWHDLESYDRFTGTAILDLAAALAAEQRAHAETRKAQAARVEAAYREAYLGAVVAGSRPRGLYADGDWLNSRARAELNEVAK